MTNHVDNDISVTSQCLRIQDDLLEDREKEMDHGNIQPNTDVHLRWNNFTEDSTKIMVMEKEEGFPSTREDKKCIEKLESLILQLFQNEVIYDMQQEAELILKSEIFDEVWFFGYALSSRDMRHARNFRVRIQGAYLYWNPWKLKNCHMLVHHGIYFPQPVNGFA